FQSWVKLASQQKGPLRPADFSDGLKVIPLSNRVRKRFNPSRGWGLVCLPFPGCQPPVIVVAAL
ncbi:hypothetical protein, partial [Lunatimonas lonarensis]|uniref:hypothetical protein n=1 Tax=Lunatimonas lonarensis TaxID=1232681 RepID=UPI001EE2EA40